MEVSFKLSKLLKFLDENKLYYKQPVGMKNEEDRVIKGFSSIYDSKANTLSRMDAQTLDWSTIKSSVIICSLNAVLPENTNIIFIPVENPRDTFAFVLYSFYPSNQSSGISPTAIIGDHCKIGENVYLGHHVVLGNNVKIGDNTQIHSNVTIYENVSIGSKCIVHSGAIIGADGFGYQKNVEGIYYKFPHIGGVIIEDNVEIGSNTCIAKGKLTDTIIKNNVKIGNLSHISHDVSIGENAMITHHVHLGGNTIIDANCWIAPGVILKSGTKIGEHALAGMGAVVLRDVSPFDVVAGIPAKPLKKQNENN